MKSKEKKSKKNDNNHTALRLFDNIHQEKIFPFLFILYFLFLFRVHCKNESTNFVYSFSEQTTMPNSKILILTGKQIQQRIDRIAYQIYENNYLEKEIVVAGIVKNGFVLAERISKKLMEVSSIKVKLAKIVLNKKHPLSEKIKITLSENSLKKNVVIVVDDVLDSGRTMMYAIDPFLKYQVKRLAAVVLVNRDHHSYPIKADYVGISLATTMQEHISVELNGGNKDAVYLS